MTTVLYEHGIGATLILVGASIYQFIIGGIWWILPGTSKTDKYIKMGFVIVLFSFFLVSILLIVPKQKKVVTYFKF